jgi:hypothetical protein
MPTHPNATRGSRPQWRQTRRISIMERSGCNGAANRRTCKGCPRRNTPCLIFEHACKLGLNWLLQGTPAFALFLLNPSQRNKSVANYRSNCASLGQLNKYRFHARRWAGPLVHFQRGSRPRIRLHPHFKSSVRV